MNTYTYPRLNYGFLNWCINIAHTHNSKNACFVGDHFRSICNLGGVWQIICVTDSISSHNGNSQIMYMQFLKLYGAISPHLDAKAACCWDSPLQAASIDLHFISGQLEYNPAKVSWVAVFEIWSTAKLFREGERSNVISETLIRSRQEVKELELPLCVCVNQRFQCRLVHKF